MDRRIRTIDVLLLAIALGASAPARAQPALLSHDELHRCATQVQSLRQDSDRLMRQTTQMQARKSSIEAQALKLQAEGDALPADDLRGHLALNERRKQHNEETVAFNAQIAQLKQQIGAVNVVRQQYDQNCSSRSYRRTDFNGLAPDAQQAMRAGLDDVRVPYLDGDPLASPR